MNFDSTYVKIDLDAIAANLDAVKEKTGVPVMAVVKADAYGHGAVQVARLLVFVFRCVFHFGSAGASAGEADKADFDSGQNAGVRIAHCGAGGCPSHDFLL